MKRAFQISAIFFLSGAVVLSGVGRAGPSADLITEGIPAIPASLSAEVKLYSTYRTSELMAWHPVKREILVRTYGYGARRRGQIHEVMSPSERLWQMTFFTDPVSAVSYDPKDGERLVCRKDGPSNLVTLLETRKRDRDERRTEYGDERDPRMRASLERIAPLNNARKIRKPLFIVQGANDPRVPLSEAEQMVEAVRRNGTPVWYLMGWNEGHGFFKSENANFLCDTQALFVKEYLLK